MKNEINLADLLAAFKIDYLPDLEDQICKHHNQFRDEIMNKLLWLCFIRKYQNSLGDAEAYFRMLCEKQEVNGASILKDIKDATNGKDLAKILIFTQDLINRLPPKGNLLNVLD